MLDEKEKYRYTRQISLAEVGLAGQEKLKRAKVLVIGAGGLGCPILQYLTGAGVGMLGIVDFDEVEKTNLHRQVLYSNADVGRKKAEVAAEKLRLVNDLITINLFILKLDYSNASDLFSQYDIIVDGTDNFACRYIVNDICIELDKPFVYGAIYKFEGQVSVFNYKNGPTYRCLFPNTPSPNASPNCSEIGVLPALPGIIGLLMTNEVLKIILELGDVLSGQLLQFNSLNTSATFIKFERKINTTVMMKNSSSYSSFDLHEYELQHYQEVDSSNLNELKTNYHYFLDVREKWENPQLSATNFIQIPLDQLEQRLIEIPRDKQILVCCQSGGRSKIAIHLLSKYHNYTNLINLKNGIKNLI